MKNEGIKQHSALLRRVAEVLKTIDYRSTQHLPSLKRAGWLAFLELHRLIHLPRREGYCFYPSAMPSVLAGGFLRGKHKLETAYRLFFLNFPVQRKKALELLGENLLTELVSSGFIVPSADSVRSELRFVPFRDFFILSDPDQGTCRETDFYVYVGGDSMELIRFVNRRLPSGERFKRGLDLCAGTTAQSCNLAARCDEIVAAEINPRAIEFAETSAFINGLKKLSIIQSNLWENVQGTFDIIVSNPPYLPMPRESVSVRNIDVFGGGDLGMDIPLQIIDGLGRYLNPGGYSAVLAASPIIRGRDVLREELEPIAVKHGLSVTIHGWKYTNLKLDIPLQLKHNISHFIFCVIESRRTGSGSVRVKHKHLPGRLSETAYARLEMPWLKKKTSRTL